MKRIRGAYLICVLLACALYAVGLTLYTSDWLRSTQTTSHTTSVGTPTSAAETTGTAGTTGTTAATRKTDATGHNGTTMGTAATASLEDGHGYNYEILTENQKVYYDIIHDAIKNHSEDVELAGASNDDLDLVYTAVEHDHPELFWTDGYRTKSSTKCLEFTDKLNMDLSEIPTTQSEIEAIAQQFIDTIPAESSTYEKVRLIYEWIINQSEYQEGENDQNIKGVFIDHTAVCSGYARTFQYLCHQLGIPCGLVSGTILENGESHAWCIVEIDGITTFVDPTWGDPTFEPEDSSSFSRGIVYDYLCVTTEEMCRDREFEVDVSTLPICDSVAYDYYRLNNLYIEEYSTEDVNALIQSAIDAGEHSVRFKLGSRDVYDKTIAFLQSEEVFSGPLSGYSTVGTYNMDTLYIVDVYWSH